MDEVFSATETLLENRVNRPWKGMTAAHANFVLPLSSFVDGPSP
jgi:hypothetical protein